MQLYLKMSNARYEDEDEENIQSMYVSYGTALISILASIIVIEMAVCFLWFVLQTSLPLMCRGVFLYWFRTGRLPWQDWARLISTLRLCVSELMRFAAPLEEQQDVAIVDDSTLAGPYAPPDRAELGYTLRETL